MVLTDQFVLEMRMNTKSCFFIYFFPQDTAFRWWSIFYHTIENNNLLWEQTNQWNKDIIIGFTKRVRNVPLKRIPLKSVLSKCVNVRRNQSIQILFKSDAGWPTIKPGCLEEKDLQVTERMTSTVSNSSKSRSDNFRYFCKGLEQKVFLNSQFMSFCKIFSFYCLEMINFDSKSFQAWSIERMNITILFSLHQLCHC